MANSRVFVVTGSNKGIGKSIVKLLLKDKEEKIVYLTSRNEELGLTAVEDLKKENLHPLYHQLDITNRSSIEKLREHLQKQHGGLDVLVNNAGIAYKVASTASFAEQAEVTVNCNFFGTLSVCEILFPILKKKGKVVNVSSMACEFTFDKLSPLMKARFADPNLNMAELKDLMTDFVNSAKDGTFKEKGFPDSAYGMSKLGVTLMTKIQEKEMDKANRNISVNCCCPGYVATDMSSYKGPLHVDEGADTPTFLALLPPEETSFRGVYVRERKIVPFPPGN